MSRVVLDGVSKRFGAVEAVSRLDLEVRDGELLSLVGPSGCGKTTTLRLIAGLESPTAGDVFFDGERVTHLRPGDRDIAMVFQLNALYPYLSVSENIAFPLRARGVSPGDIASEVARVADLVGIADLLGHYPSDVHPADGQRVAIAKAIVRQPRAFLFDEPLSHLDSPMRVRMRAEIKHLHDTLGRTMLFVTHDQAEALALSDRIGVMRSGELVQLGTPGEVFHRPNTAYVAEFVGVPSINLIPIDFAESSGVRQVVVAGHAVAAGGLLEEGPVGNRWGRLPASLLGVRPRYVSLRREDGRQSERSGVPGVVDVTEPMGRETLAHIRVSDSVEIRALVPIRDGPREGETIVMSFDEPHMRLFDAASGASLHTTE